MADIFISYARADRAAAEALATALDAQGLSVWWDKRITGGASFAAEIEQELYRVAQEALNNVLKHSNAHQIAIHLHQEHEMVTLEIVDNGKGFDPNNGKETSGLGLKLIRDRVEMLGGFYDLDSSEGQGCRVSLTIPIVSSEVD